MKYFIFRNNTIEPFFGITDIGYSGYDDISEVPSIDGSYVWLYQVPIKCDRERLSSEVESYTQKLQLTLSRIPSTKQVVLFTLFDLGNPKYYASDYRLESAIEGYNSNLYSLAAENTNIKIIDIKCFFEQFPRDLWMDGKHYFTSQLGINPKLASQFKTWFSERMDEIEFKRKKCLVLDLDNTLWGGILGEDGYNGIKIGGDYPGNAFMYFQEALIELSKSGVILAICSKNNESDVKEAWLKNPFIVLKDNYVVAYRINWENKADNIVELSKELNIGLDSLVFIDDNPTERELVRQLLPMVDVPEFPKQPYMLMYFFEKEILSRFRVYSLTEEDRNKTQQYKDNRDRVESAGKFVNFEDYISSLELVLSVEEANELNMPRIAQMTQKTNQFNLTTRRYTDSDIYDFIDSGALVYSLSVRDKFGDNGITGCAILKEEGDGFIFDTLLLSCRILGKNIEYTFVETILDLLSDKGVKCVKGEFIPTQKNMQVADFYDKLGFKCVEELGSGYKKYILNLIK